MATCGKKWVSTGPWDLGLDRVTTAADREISWVDTRFSNF